MKMQIRRVLILFISILFMSIAYADTTNTSVPAVPPPSPLTQKTDLLLYLNQVLTDAGFSDETRKYLVEIARTQLNNINSADLADKTRTLKMNLYIFLKSMSLKCESPAASDEIRKQYYFADLNPEPWNEILSPKVLAAFKEKHIFENLSVKDIKNCNFTFCQVWPFCEN